MNPRQQHSSHPTPSCHALAALALAACSKGEFTGEVAHSSVPAVGEPTSPPAPKHEDVLFTWESLDESYAGRIAATLPDGERFKGRFHEIVTTIPIARYDDFYGWWYAGPWVGPSWRWGGVWPYYDSVEEFVSHYTGTVVARLTGSRGHQMRCHFELDDRYGGMKAGGKGECQLSTGERITAKFDPT